MSRWQDPDAPSEHELAAEAAEEELREMCDCGTYPDCAFDCARIEYEETERRENQCMCSDPGCPCGGRKRGGPP